MFTFILLYVYSFFVTIFCVWQSTSEFKMSGKSIISFSSIAGYFDERRIIQKGENALKSNNVVNTVFDGELSVIKGAVQASMKNKTYKVEITLSDDGIKDSSCECPRGQGLCHHMAALALFAHYNFSSTDEACAWMKRKAAEDERPLTAEECFGAKDYHIISEDDVPDALVDQFASSLDLCGPTALSWILSGEPKNLPDILPTVEDILTSNEYLTAPDPMKFLEERLKVTSEKILEVAEKTVGQSNNPDWLVARKRRLTASNFGQILKACRGNKYPPSLFKTLLVIIIKFI